MNIKVAAFTVSEKSSNVSNNRSLMFRDFAVLVLKTKELSNYSVLTSKTISAGLKINPAFGSV